LPLSVSGEDVAFQAWGSTGEAGIYVVGGGAVATFARASDLCPSGNYSCVLQNPSLSGDALAFARADYSGPAPVQDALYLFRGARLSTIVDTSTPIPEGTGTFSDFEAFQLDNDELAFIGRGAGPAGQMGVYRTRQGALERVADLSMIAPGTAERFSVFWNIAFSQDDVVFSAGYGPPSSGLNDYAGGLYRSRNGMLEVLTDSSRPSPSGYGNFAAFGQASISAGGVAFVGYGPNPEPHVGIYYLDPGGDLTTIADDIHPFFGDSLSNFMDLCPQALNGQQLAIAVNLKDVGAKVYLIYWPVE
jgi:hypothetical protein